MSSIKLVEEFHVGIYPGVLWQEVSIFTYVSCITILLTQVAYSLNIKINENII